MLDGPDRGLYPLMGQIVFPAPRGGYLLRSSWHTHWQSIRASAGMAGQDFYEVKHRAIQWMVDPVEDGGLGLDLATAAAMVGHDDDDDYLIATVYTKLDERRAPARAQRAMDAYQQQRLSHTTFACSESNSPANRGPMHMRSANCVCRFFSPAALVAAWSIRLRAPRNECRSCLSLSSTTGL